MIFNMTPHPVAVADDDGRVVVRIPPSGATIRLRETVEPAGSIEIEGVEVPAVRKVLGEPEGLPEGLEAGDVLIVSAIALAPVSAALAGTGVTVVAPDTGPDSAVRDADGRIVAVRRLMVAGGS